MVCRCIDWSVLLAYLMTDQHGKPDTLPLKKKKIYIFGGRLIVNDIHYV